MKTNGEPSPFSFLQVLYIDICVFSPRTAPIIICLFDFYGKSDPSFYGNPVFAWGLGI